MRTLLAANGGGHLTQLIMLSRRLPFDPGEVVWFTFDTPQSRSMLEGERVVFADVAPPRDWRAAIRNARLAAASCRRLRFDVAISTGASIAVSTLPVARRHGVKVHYIESAARVDGPSVSGRMLAATPGVHTSCQYRSWASSGWHYAGSVFDSFGPGPVDSDPKIRRVVVTLGSQDGYPFPRLVAGLSRVIPPEAEVLWQIGSTDGSPHGIDGRTSVPAAELEAAIAEADLVIAHAGVGSALTSLAAGRHPVLVPRRVSTGEHIDDHQIEVARLLAGRSLATTCSPDELTTELLMDAAGRSTVEREDPPKLDLGADPTGTGHA